MTLREARSSYITSCSLPTAYKIECNVIPTSLTLKATASPLFN